MKSRVQKNHELYDNLASSVEEKVESNDLSSYANRLNEIDQRFERMNIMNQHSHNPVHAKDVTSDVDDFPNAYDTFENEYLKDFLDEVKEYNVKKGYRTSEDTQANILNAFSTEPRKPKQSEDVSIESLVHSIEANQDVVKKVNQMTESESLLEPELQDTIEIVREEAQQEPDNIFDSKELLLRQGIDPDAMWQAPDPKVESMVEEVVEETAPESDPVIETVFDEDIDDAILPDDELTRIAVQETKTIQLKLDAQEKDLKTISKSMVHTNRILNTVIAIVLLCFLLVVAFIVKMFWFN